MTELLLFNIYTSQFNLSLNSGYDKALMILPLLYFIQWFNGYDVLFLFANQIKIEK